MQEAGEGGVEGASMDALFHAWAKLARGRTRSELGDLDGALRLCREAATVIPRAYEYELLRLSDLLADKRDRIGAIQVLTEITRMMPEDARAHTRLARALEKAGATDGAGEEYRRAVQLDSSTAQRYIDLGWFLVRQGDLIGAAEQVPAAAAAGGTAEQVRMLHVLVLLALRTRCGDAPLMDVWDKLWHPASVPLLAQYITEVFHSIEGAPL